MDLETLKAGVLEQAQKTKELRLEADRLEGEVCNIVKDNIENIVVPYFEKMNKFIESLRTLTDSVPKMTEYSEDIPLGEGVDRCYILHLEVSAYGVHLTFRYTGSYGWKKWIDYSQNERNDIYRYRSHYNLRNIFINEEVTQKIVDLAQTKYICILNIWAEYIKGWNETLADRISNITVLLSKAHCVEHNEDGTVEIHLGGKTYKATLTEE